MSIKVFTGPMKSGKSDEMIREFSRKKKYANKKVLHVKADPSRQFGDAVNISRDNASADCAVIPANNPDYIYLLIDASVDIIAIDEAQFFKSEKIVNIVRDLSDKGFEVMVAGLDMNSDRKPYRFMGDIMAIANVIEKKKSICEFCKCENAEYSVAMFDKTEEDAVNDDGDSKYKAACLPCYLKYKK